MHYFPYVVTQYKHYQYAIGVSYHTVNTFEEKGTNIAQQIFFLNHKKQMDVRVSCKKWGTLFRKLSFNANERRRNTSASYFWTSKRELMYRDNDNDEDEDEDDDAFDSVAVREIKLELKNDVSTDSDESENEEDDHSPKTHPLNNRKNDFSQFGKDITCRTCPVNLQYAVNENMQIDSRLMNCCGMSVSWYIDLDGYSFNLLIGNGVDHPRWQHMCIWKMVDLYRCRLSLRYIHGSIKGDMLCNGMLLRLFTEKKAAMSLEQAQARESRSEDMTVSPTYTEFISAVIIQAAARRYIAWRLSFAPGKGSMYKKARLSYESFASGLVAVDGRRE